MLFFYSSQKIKDFLFIKVEIIIQNYFEFEAEIEYGKFKQ